MVVVDNLWNAVEFFRAGLALSMDISLSIDISGLVLLT